MSFHYLCNGAPRVLLETRAVEDEGKVTSADVQAIWVRVKTALDRALMPHPEARAAVIVALEDVSLLALERRVRAGWCGAGHGGCEDRAKSVERGRWRSRNAFAQHHQTQLC